MDDEDGDGGGVRAGERGRVVDLVDVVAGERRERGHAGSFCLLTSAL